MNATAASMLYAAPLGFVLFSAVWFVAGAVRPGYSMARHPISSLALPPNGGWQIASFLLTGVLFLIAAHGLKACAPALPWKSLAAVGLGLVGAGLFPTDPMNGYPAGTPALPSPPTGRGVLHRVLSAPVFLGIPIHLFGWASFFWTSSQTGRAVAGAVALALYGVAFAAMNAAFKQVGHLPRIAGALQRACVTIGFGWIAALPWLVSCPA